MRKSYMSIVLGFLAVNFSYAQVTGDFQTVSDGDWDNISIWQRYNGVSFVAAVAFPTAATANVITIRNTHDVAISAISDGIGIDQTTIQAGGSLTIVGFSISVENGVGNDLTNAGTITADPSAIEFFDLAVYVHSQNGGVIPLAIWNLDTECQITGATTTAPSNLGQSFYHLTWNSAQTASINLNGALTEVIGGNFTISNTGAANERLVLFANAVDGQALAVTGNLTISGGSSVAFTGTGTNGTVSIGGNFTNSSTRRQTLANGAGGSIAMDVAGIFSHSVNVFRLTGNASASAILNLSGNMTMAGTGFSSVAGSTSEINFLGGATQTFTRTGAPAQSGPLAWRVIGSTTLDIGAASFLSGTTTTSSFFLEAGSTLLTRAVNGTGTNNNGAIQSATNQGSIRVATLLRTYQSGSTIIYNGAALQQLGNGHPATAGVNTIINNVAGVTTVGSRTISGDLTLQAGNLNAVAGGTLTLDQSIFPNSNFITTTATSDFVVNGTGITGTFPFPAGAQTVRNFTLNRPTGNLTFGNNVTISGLLTLTEGELDFTGRSLFLNGTFTATNGNLFSSSPINTLLQIGGTGAFGSLAISASPNNQVGTFTFNRATAGTMTLSSDLFVASIFNLNNGTLTNAGSLTLENNATLNRTAATAIITTNRPSVDIGETYNVNYAGSTAFSTALELPDPSNTTDLGNLTISSTNTITLSQALFVNGSLNLNGGTFSAGVNTIAMNGSSWNDNAGSFLPGSGTVIFNRIAGTVVGGSSSPLFGNVTLNNGATLTFPSGVITIQGNIQFNSASTFNANGGTVVLNGASTTTFAGGNRTFANISLNKTGSSDVSLTSGVLLTGTLDVVGTGCDFGANGLLTLVSNVSGTARIGALGATQTVSGNVRAQRFIAGVGRGYRDISSPVLNPPVSDITASGISVTGPFTGSSFPCAGCGTNNPSLYFYNETVAGLQSAGYVAHPASGGNSTTSLLAPGQGYNLLVRNELGSPTITLVGTINSFPSLTALPFTYTTTVGGVNEDGWNFVGNPFPSQIDWDIATGWTKTLIQGNQINVWDPTKNGTGGYRTWNGTTGDLGSGRIASGQGFWSKGSAAGASLAVSELAKLSTATSFLRTSESIAVNSIEISLRSETGEFQDNAYIQFDPKAQITLDQLDGIKLKSPQFNMTTLSSDGIPLSINLMGALPTNENINLGITEVEPGSYSIQVQSNGDLVGTTVYLKDKVTDKSVEVSSDAYHFTVSNSNRPQLKDRFYLYFSEKPADPANRGFSVYPNPTDHKINVEVSNPEISSDVEILDSVGKKIGSFKLNEEGLIKKGFYDLESLSTGLYYVRVYRNSRPEIIKIIKL